MEKSNPMNDFLEAQKDMFSTWQNMMEETTKVFTQSSSMFVNPIQAYKDMFSNLTKNPLNGSFDIFDVMRQSSNIYMNIYNMYQDLYKNSIEPTNENIEKVVSDWKTRSNEFYQQFFIPYLPTQLQSLIQQAMQTSSYIELVFSEIFSPFKDSLKSMNEAIAKGILNDPDAFIKFLEEWKDNYNKTLKKVFNMPAFGLTRNFVENQGKVIDNYVVLMTYLSEVLVIISKLSSNNMEKVIRDSFENLKNGAEVPSFEEFYNYWKNSLSNAFDELFYSDEFSKLLGRFVEALADFKIESDKILEKYLSALPVPTKTEMRSLYKTVYELKKEVRELKRELKKEK